MDPNPTDQSPEEYRRQGNHWAIGEAEGDRKLQGLLGLGRKLGPYSESEL